MGRAVVGGPCGTGIDFNTDVNNCGFCGNYCDPAGMRSCIEGQCRRPGRLNFVLAWDRSADLELAVVTPTMEEVNYRLPTGGGGTFDVLDPMLGPASVYWTNAPPSGPYVVCVTPVNVTQTTNYTVRVYVDNVLQQTFPGIARMNVPFAGCTNMASGVYVGTFMVR